MKLFAGIDGGGTRTRLALVWENGELAGSAETGCCSFAELGMEGAKRGFQDLWEAAWKSAGKAPRPADGLFIGSGSILSEEDERTNCQIAASLGLARPPNVRAGNDALNALAGGLAGRPGILLICGTGSACFGRNALGNAWRTGGWGHLLNDAGSAYAFGTAAMIAATREADGRGLATTLTGLVRDTFQLRDLRDIYRKVHHSGLSRSEIAALACGVVACAGGGDPLARQILREGAAGLVEMVVTVARRLALERPELALTGGLIKNADSFRSMFINQLRDSLPGVVVASDGFEPVFGAVMLAYEDAKGVPPPHAFLEKLRAVGSVFPLFSHEQSIP